MTTPRHYYNEIDPYAAQWLRNLMAAGLIYPGDVDERSIEDVTPTDLGGYTQCHFFAGIAGWQRALQLAQWPVDREVWTGSCPCQPFSAAGKGAGFADERHLWPAWFHLIEQCRPPVVFGEQVASSAVDAWVDLVHADMEGLAYAFRAVPFPAAGVGAPHIRDRTIWVAHAASVGRVGRWSGEARLESCTIQRSHGLRDVSGLAHADGRNASAEREQCSGQHGQQSQDGRIGGLAHADHDGLQGRTVEALRGTGRRQEGHAAGCGDASLAGTCGLGHADDMPHGTQRSVCSGASAPRDGSIADRPAGPVNGFWADADWLLCRDGKWRPVEPGTFPLAHGVPNRVGRLRAFGNAIVPPAVAEFIKAYMSCRP